MMPLFLLTFAFSLGIGFLFATTDRQDVMAHWDEKRCNLPVMLFGNFYKPTENSKSDIQFATENFQFCASKIVEQAMKVVAAPIMEVMNQQLDIFAVLGKIIGGVREMVGNFFRTFSNLLEGMFQRFMAISFEIRRIFIEFFSMMSRASAIGMSTVFAGMATIVGIQNVFDFIVKVVLIVIGIMAAIIIVLIFILFPVMPVILTTITVMIAAGIGAAGENAGVFCFTPGTRIKLKDGREIPIEMLSLDDRLENDAIVEGILQTNGSTTDVYQLGKVYVSGDHLVFYEPLNEWICVKDHPHAHKQVKREPILYCLNTSTHTVEIGGFRFSDWEELPETSTGGWNQLVATILHGIAAPSTKNYPLLSGAWFAKTPTGNVRVRDLRMGDTIMDENGSLTNVLGIYYGLDDIASTNKCYWMSDSIWVRAEAHWKQVGISTCEVHRMNGFHLITDSGTFMIYDDSTSFCVRDFTEVGIHRISETYEWTKKTIS
jgi:hypothetical protein